jgi:hypothetical protein
VPEESEDCVSFHCKGQNTNAQHSEMVFLATSIVGNLAAWLPTTTSVGNFLYTASTALVGIVLKDHYDHCRRPTEREDVDRRMTQKSRDSSFESISVDSSLLVDFEDLENLLRLVFEASFRGVIVLGAPQGAGKSTLFSKALRKHVKQSGAQVFYSTSLVTKHFRETIGISEFGLFGDHFPNNSIIVIDQIDAKELSGDMCQLIVELATSARNSGRFDVFILFSNARAFAQASKLNGQEKICAPIASSRWRWSTEQAKEFAKRLLPNAADDIIDELALSRRGPGVISSVVRCSSMKPDLLTSKGVSDIMKQREDEWSKFATVEKEEGVISLYN